MKNLPTKLWVGAEPLRRAVVVHPRFLERHFDCIRRPGSRDGFLAVSRSGVVHIEYLILSPTYVDRNSPPVALH